MKDGENSSRMLQGYYFITDEKLSRAGNINDVKSAVLAGAAAVQYRAKGATFKEMRQQAAILCSLCEKSIPFLINDYINIALEVGADGVHLGQDDMPYEKARKIMGENKIIGITVHTTEEAEQAYMAGADYLGVAPVFKTTTKPDAGAPSGITLIQDIRNKVPLPLVAIGGITLENAPCVIAAGADAVCAISAVVTAKNVKAEIEKFQMLFVK